MKKIAYHDAIIDAQTGKGKLATITVYNAGTLNKSTIYSDSSGTAKSNPFQTSSIGVVNFYADSGFYDIEVSGSDITAYKKQDVPIFALSIPPSGKYKAVNLYVNPETGKLNVEYEEI